MATMSLAKNDTPKVEATKKDFVVAVHGRMLNLFTNVWITSDPKLIELDDFVRGQMEAGKLKIVVPT